MRDAISVQGDEDWFSIEITQPTAFAFTLYPDAGRVDGRAEAFDVVVDVFEPDLQRLARIDDLGNDTRESEIVSLPAAGRY